MKLEFPILIGTQTEFPSESACPECGKTGIFHPNAGASIRGGALYLDRSSSSSKQLDNLSGFLDLDWKGESEDGSAIASYAHVRVPLAENVHGGQFELYFCSTNCLRLFLNSWVDELELKKGELKSR